MLEKSFTLLFYLKKPKNYCEGPMPIYLRITVDGIAKEIFTGVHADPEKWNGNAARLYGIKEDAKLLNATLDTLQTKVYEARRILIEKNEIITADILRGVLKGKTHESKLLIQVFQEHNDQMKSLIGKDFSAGTLVRYQTSLRHTQEFIRWKYRVDDIDIRKLNYSFVSQYEFWFKTIRLCNHNTTMKYISNLKKIVNRCIKVGWLDKDPFMGFKMHKKEIEPEFLTDQEIAAITIKKFNTERLSQVRDIFLFCCYTGLAFVDVKKLKAEEIRIGIDGSKWIFTSRKKTSTLSRIPLLPPAIEILERYKDHPYCLKISVRYFSIFKNDSSSRNLKQKSRGNSS
jgi:hypothetical protein